MSLLWQNILFKSSRARSSRMQRIARTKLVHISRRAGEAGTETRPNASDLGPHAGKETSTLERAPQGRIPAQDVQGDLRRLWKRGGSPVQTYLWKTCVLRGMLSEARSGEISRAKTGTRTSGLARFPILFTPYKTVRKTKANP